MNIFEFGYYILTHMPKGTLKDAIIQIGAAGIGVGGAILVFYLTSKEAKVKADLEKERFERDKLRYLYHLIKGSHRFSEVFRDNLNDFLIQFDNNVSSVPQYSNPIRHTIERFVNKINQEEHFHAYRNQIPKGISITSIFDNIDFIDALHLNIYEQYKEIAKRQRENGEDFRLLMKDAFFQASNNEEALKFKVLNKVPGANELLQAQNLAFQEVAKVHKSGNLRLIQSTFVSPLGKALFDYRKKTGDASFKILEETLGSANQVIVFLETNNTESIISLKDDFNNLTTVCSRLGSNMKSIEEFMTKIG